jgi:molybdopterin molybdotransferase
VRAADTAEARERAPARLSFAGEVPMGAASGVSVGAGQAVWVATGSMLPQGADGVVMVERTAREDETVLVRQEVGAGDNVVRRGADLRAGDAVLRAGRRLRPQDVAVLASMGIAAVPVRPRPRVAIVSGGDELVSPGALLGPGQIYDSNSYAMAAQVAAWGAEPHIMPHTPDRPEAVRAALREALGQAQIVLLSGGSSVGIKDLTAEAIDAAGQPGVVVHGVAMRPGRPTIVGVVDGVLVIGIPGNPVSAMVACEVFARPAIEALLGQQPARIAGVVGDYAAIGRLAERVGSQVGRQDYVRVRLQAEADGLAVYPVPGGSGVIRSMVDADGLLVVPPERAAIEAGEQVEVRLF